MCVCTYTHIESLESSKCVSTQRAYCLFSKKFSFSPLLLNREQPLHFFLFLTYLISFYKRAGMKKQNDSHQYTFIRVKECLPGF